LKDVFGPFDLESDHFGPFRRIHNWCEYILGLKINIIQAKSQCNVLHQNWKITWKKGPEIVSMVWGCGPWLNGT
jgi:hypothetical protein